MYQKFMEKLAPKQKRLLMAALAGGGIIGAVALFSDGPSSDRDRRAGSNDPVQHVFSDRDTRELTFESLATQLEATRGENERLREDMSQLRTDVERSSSSGLPSQVSRELDSLSRELDLIREENRELREIATGFDFSVLDQLQERPEPLADRSASDERDAEPDVADSDNASSPRQVQQEPQRGADVPSFNQNVAVNPDEVFLSPPPPRPQVEGEGGAEGEEAPRGLRIISHHQAERETDGREDQAEDAPYIPSASIVSGVLLNGMDAPTNQGSRRDPVPSTMRVKHEAILPNRFTSDITECHIIVSGHGDLSTERALLRTESLSCLKENGDVIESPLEGYVVGSDGKTGIRGRLVSKQGAMIARSMVAGFFSGASQALNVSPIPVINTQNNSSGQTQYQSNYSSDLLQGAGAQGAGQALDRVAQFYVDMAESIFPVIEVNAGTQVDIILTRGAELRIRSSEDS
ncbi:TraB/VirB10 family protein [Halomonas casei]|uniref:TraB/VirB10 family protein n=2 Tax=Halomonas TaxID=2745 RepID=UPI003CF4053B